MPGFSLHRLIARLELEKNLGVEYLSLPGGLNSLDEQIRAAKSDKAQTPGEKILPAASPAKKMPPPLPVPSLPAERQTPSAPLPVQPAAGAVNRVPAAPTTQPALPPGYVSLVPYQEPPPHPEREALLSELRQECLSCEKCVLCRRRTQVAWGEGNLAAETMFIGEGPGRDEDVEGRPFVGRSGRLLTDIIEKGMKLRRADVYITNVVKCRPPGNRDPKPEETAACRSYLDRQIEVVAPKLLVAVGGVATRTLLGLPPEASGLRGRWYEYRGLPLFSIYHPSYLLRQRRNDRDRTQADHLTWRDVQTVMAKLEALR